MLRHVAPLVLSGCMLFADFAPEGGAGEGGSPVTGGATVSGGSSQGGQGAAGSAGGGPAGGATTTGGNATGGNATGGNAIGGNATGGNATGGSGGSGGSGGEGGGQPGPAPLSRWVNDGARVIYVGEVGALAQLIEIDGEGIAAVGGIPGFVCDVPCELDVLTVSGQTHFSVVSGSQLSRKFPNDPAWTPVGPARNAAFELGQADLWYCDSNSNELRNTKNTGEVDNNNICLDGTRIAGITGGALTWGVGYTLACTDDGQISETLCADNLSNLQQFYPSAARDVVAALNITAGLFIGPSAGDPWCPPMYAVSGVDPIWATVEVSLGNVHEGDSRPILLLGEGGTLRLCTIEFGMTGLQCPADPVIASGVQVGQFSLWQDETGAGEAVWWDSEDASVHRRSL